MTMNLLIENHSPFARIAELYCPNVYEQLIDRKEFRRKTNQTSKYLITNINILLFCLSISILILLFTSICLTYLTSIRLVILALQQKLR